MIREFKIYLSSQVQDIPNDYYHQMHGFVSSLLGENKYKEQGNRYSYSMLNIGDFNLNARGFQLVQIYLYPCFTSDYELSIAI